MWLICDCDLRSAILQKTSAPPRRTPGAAPVAPGTDSRSASYGTHGKNTRCCLPRSSFYYLRSTAGVSGREQEAGHRPAGAGGRSAGAGGRPTSAQAEVSIHAHIQYTGADRRSIGGSTEDRSPSEMSKEFEPELRHGRFARRDPLTPCPSHPLSQR